MRYRLLACLLALAAAPARGATGDLPDRWSLDAVNTLRVETYRVDGDESASPYRFTGGQWYDDLFLSGTRRRSPYELERGYLGLSRNDSAYRGTEQGVVLERGQYFREKGDSSVPYRLHAGDFFARQSLRTIQRGLKGMQLELQPPGSGDALHSVQLFSGLTGSTFRDLDEDLQIFSGVSWVTETPRLGAIMAGAVHGYRESGPATAARTQWVASLAWSREMNLGTQDLELEAEYAFLDGDAGLEAARRDRSDDGLMMELEGRGGPLGYRLVYERYGEDFRPAGAAITADQRRLEAHGSWRFDWGLTGRLRAQVFRNALESANPLDTRVLGATATGRLLPHSPLQGSVDAYVQTRDDDDGLVDAVTRSLNASFSLPLAPRLTGRAGLTFVATDDRRRGADAITRQASTGVTWDFRWRGVKGIVSPALLMRRVTGPGNGSEVMSPSLSLSLLKGPHRLRLDHNTQRLDVDTATPDVLSRRTSLTYSFTRGDHTLGLDLEALDRQPTPGEGTESWRLGFTWTMRLDRPAIPTPARPAPAPTPVTTVTALADIPPGAPLSATRTRLDAQGLPPPVERPGLTLYEVRLFQEINRRQRLAIEHAGGTVERAALVIDFEEVGDTEGARDTYERVRELLLARYGQPALIIEEGRFGPGLANRLNAGRFRRMLEWPTAHGRVRFGIPRRDDGIVTMEVQHAKGFPPGPRADWSIGLLP